MSSNTPYLDFQVTTLFDFEMCFIKMKYTCSIVADEFKLKYAAFDEKITPLYVMECM